VWTARRWQGYSKAFAQCRPVRSCVRPAMRPFHVQLAIMPFARLRSQSNHRTAAKTVVLKLLPATHKSDASKETLAFMVCNALLACSDSNYAASLEWFGRLRPIAHRCGAASPSAISCISLIRRQRSEGRRHRSPALWCGAFSKETSQPYEPDAPATLEQ
jgi:hypothetical protein